MEQIEPGDDFNKQHEKYGDHWVWSGAYKCSRVKEKNGIRYIGFDIPGQDLEFWEDEKNCVKVEKDDD